MDFVYNYAELLSKDIALIFRVANH